MTDISFYHLEVSGLEVAMPKLLEKVLASGFKAVIKFGNSELLEKLNKALWTFEEGSFLPHGTKNSAFESEHPIYLTIGDDNPNDATLLLLVNDANFGELEDYERVLIMFDGHSGDIINNAREKWKTLNDEGHKLTYFQQNEKGGWEKKMET